MTRRVRFKCRGNGDTKVRLVPKQAKPTTWPAVYQSRKQIRTHLDPSDSVSKDLREGELKKKKRKFRTKSLTVDREQTDPHFFFFFATKPHLCVLYFTENLQFQLTRSSLFLAPRESGGCSGNPGISLEEPHFP